MSCAPRHPGGVGSSCVSHGDALSLSTRTPQQLCGGPCLLRLQLKQGFRRLVVRPVPTSPIIRPMPFHWASRLVKMGRTISSSPVNLLHASRLSLRVAWPRTPRPGMGLFFELLRAVQQGPVFARRSSSANTDRATKVPLTLPSLLISIPELGELGEPPTRQNHHYG